MEKISNLFGKKQEDSGSSPQYSDAPPSYEAAQQSNLYQRPQQAVPQDNQYPPPAPPPNQQQYQQQPPQNYDPMADPNVIKVAPQKVNISQARPEHLNPAYPQFQQREAERRKFGHQDPQYKHGAPLSQGHKDRSSRTGGSAFPGSSGATYNDAANKR